MQAVDVQTGASVHVPLQAQGPASTDDTHATRSTDVNVLQQDSKPTSAPGSREGWRFISNKHLFQLTQDATPMYG